jgi:uncharacterized phage protein gp47/JayE
MYENQTKAAILQRMLDASPADVDKREGSVTWDLLSPAAIELALAYIGLDGVLTFGFADTTYGPYLDMRANELGLTRKPATVATGTLRFSGPNGTLIPLGTRASTGGSSPLYFETTAAGTLSGGSVVVAAKAVDAGAASNVSIGTVTTMTGNLVGIVDVTNPVNFDGGSDAETDAALLTRYFDRARRPATSGNANHYRQWALEVAGISDAKVYEVWNGPGTVKVVLLDNEKTAPAPSVVAEVAAHIESVRPVGATVTVVGAVEVPINVSVKVTLAPGATVAEVKAQFEAGITTYLQSLAFVDPLVRYTRIAAVLLDIPPVVDYADLTLNGSNTNVVVADGSVAVLGTVTVTT